ncbi:ATP-binding cassette subfamily B protein [Kutzneria buriramensis]|uniref:ATP-binding cassette subfamily B protein n=1 Tax=Kutzneria buriramensis TaxID=1045776 RepID=A0A3E0HIA9_9PSEU|nr:ATP-binding cassette subfamily B protein [Kutzneria buriramensis]
MRTSLAAVRVLVGTAIRVDPPRAVLVLTLTPLINILAGGQPIGIQWMVDGATGRQLGQAVAGALLLVVITIAAHQITSVATDLRLVLEQRVALEFDRRLITVCAGRAHIDHFQDAEFLDAAELVRQRRGQLGGALSAFVENVNLMARFVGSAGLLALANPVLALLPLFVVPLAFAIRWQSRLVSTAEQAGAETDRLRRSMFSLATDPAAARELRLYRLSGEIGARHRAAFAAASGPREAARLKGALAVAAGWLLYSIGLVSGLFLVARAVIDGTASAGQAVLVVLLGTRLVIATTGLGWLFGWLRRTLDTIGLYLRLVRYAEDADESRETDRPSRGDLVLHGVSFSYPGRPVPALGPIDLRLPAGSTVAVVGDNGAGKSTLVALLAGLYPPSSGSITLAGRNLADTPPQLWRRDIAACFQDFCRFEFSAGETVGVGDLTKLGDPDAVAGALAAAGAADVVAGLPSGVDTQLGRTLPGGTDLSAGQWQKLALARARMRTEPALVLLDEPAASLDPDSEAELLRRLLAAGPTRAVITVIVSHRFTTVREADLIVLLDKGELVEVGTHAELIARDGRYAHMYALHAAAYTSAAEGEVAAGMHSDLVVDPRQVALHGADGDVQAAGDLPVGQSAAGQ